MLEMMQKLEQLDDIVEELKNIKSMGYVDCRPDICMYVHHYAIVYSGLSNGK